MKSSKKVLSYVLTVAMIISLVSAMTMTSFAAPAGTALTFTPDGGSAATYTLPATVKNIAATTTVGAIKKDATVVMEMTQKDIDDIDGVAVKFSGRVALTGSTASNVTYFKETTPLGDTAALSTISGALAAAETIDVNFGDVIWVVETDTTVTVARVVIATASGGTIGGEGDKLVVPFNVVVPLTTNFALDPYEMLDKSGIAGADYTITNKTPTYPVKVDFTLNTAATTTVAIVENPEEVDALTKAHVKVVTAKDVTLTSGAVTAADYEAAGDTEAAKEIDLARRTQAFPAVAATTAGGSISFSFALQGFGTTVEKGNVGVFTYQGKLFEGDYAANKIVVAGTYKLAGMGVNKYADDVKPLLQGSGSYPLPTTGYGFGAKTGAGTATVSEVSYTLQADPIGGAQPIAGYAKFAASAAALKAAPATFGIEFDFKGAAFEDIWWSDGKGAFAASAEAFDVDEEEGTIMFTTMWNNATAGKNYEYITLDNGDSFLLLVELTD